MREITHQRHATTKIRLHSEWSLRRQERSCRRGRWPTQQRPQQECSSNTRPRVLLSRSSSWSSIWLQRFGREPSFLRSKLYTDVSSADRAGAFATMQIIGITEVLPTAVTIWQFLAYNRNGDQYNGI